MMTDKEKIEKIQALVSDECNDWAKEAKFRLENRGWLRLSGKISLCILSVLKEKGLSQAELARQLGVTPQQVSKLVKGRENFTLKTIYEVNEVLKIDLFAMLCGIPDRAERDTPKPLAIEPVA